MSTATETPSDSTGQAETRVTKKMKSTSDQVFLTPEELADRWKVTTMTLYRWRAKFKLRSLKMGHLVRFRLSDVEEIEREAIS